MTVTMGKLPDALAYALGGTAVGAGFDVSLAVVAMARAFEGGEAVVAESFNIELESGDTLTTETGDHVQQEEAP